MRTLTLRSTTFLRVHVRPALRCLLVTAALLTVLPNSGRAQSAAAGSITGRVFNAATRGYVRNAEVRVEGTGIVAYTEDAGIYRLTGVPSGEVTLTVAYTGTQPASAKLQVTAGQTATRDFELQSTVFNQGAGAAAQDPVLTLGAFVVASEREGNAKAIMARSGIWASRGRFNRRLAAVHT
jgi:iron complex outermembrane receptor protein